MKRFATLTTMAFLLATAGAFAQTPSTTTTDKPAAKTAKAKHKGHKKVGKTTTAPPSTPAAK